MGRKMIKEKTNLTIVIPVDEREEIVEQFIEGNKYPLTKYNVIVVNKRGGDRLKEYANIYINGKDNLSVARRKGINLTDTDIMFVKLFSEICIRFLWKKTDYFENRTMLDKYYRYIILY